MDLWDCSRIEDTHRRLRLEAAHAFAEIAKAVADDMRIQCTHSDPCDEAAGFMRIVCCMSIDRDLFDLFFNSQNGYRGRYFVSSEEGLLANGQLLRLVSPPLAAFTVHADMPLGHAELSLRAPSAKAWLTEVGKGFCPTCAGEWTTPQDAAAEILNGRWEHENEAKARYGRKAPWLQQLRFMGGFVDRSGQEYVTTQKRDRAQQIHEFGWS
jgi:hypothetical protein